MNEKGQYNHRNRKVVAPYSMSSNTSVHGYGKNKQAHGLTLSSWKSGNSEHLLRHLKGLEMPVPVRPTQYEMSTIRASSSSSEKSSGETERLSAACRSRGTC